MDTGFTSSSACAYGNPRSSTAFTVLKMAVFAPMPSASTSSATTANPRLLFNVRKAKRTSWPNAMLGPAWQLGEHARSTAYARLESRTIHCGRAARTGAALHLPGASIQSVSEGEPPLKRLETVLETVSADWRARRSIAPPGDHSGDCNPPEQRGKCVELKPDPRDVT